MNILSRPCMTIVGTPLEADVRGLMRAANYTWSATVEAVSWIESRGTVAGCPSVDEEDCDAVDALVLAHRNHMAEEAFRGDVECHPAGWPEWTDYHVYEPTEGDREWAAAEMEVETVA